jgi:arylsulfatase A-like enzyme
MASLFTSTYPINHGMVHGINQRKRMQEVLSGDLTTLPEILQKKGYTTFGVSSNHNLTAEFGFSRGFDYFKYLGWRNADMVNNTVSSWEAAIKQSEKYFLWIHYNDPHIPYAARSPWIERYALQSPDQALRLSRKVRSHSRLNEFIPTLKKDPQSFADLIALYDSEISFVDFHIGKLMEKFAFESDALIIITSDHGEEFLEHGYLGHGNNLHKETVAVPLILKQPSSSKKKTVDRYVNLLDIMPTILDLLNINFPDQTLGESVLKRKGILRWFKKIIPKKKTWDYNFIELDKGQHSLKSIMTPEWKYIFNHQDNTEQLYKIDEDPLELYNIFYKEPERCRQFWKQLFHWVSQSKKYPPRKRSVTLSPEEEEKLRALGYIQGK